MANDYLYSQGRARRDPRFCRTHAFMAQLFANSTANWANARTWNYISLAWEELAAIKQRTQRDGKPGWPSHAE